MDEEVKETGTQEPAVQEKTDATLKPTPSDSLEQEKVAELVRVLRDYFDNDANLRKQYEGDRPISDLFSLRLVQALKPKKETLIAAIKQCKKLKLDASTEKVRANMSQGRTILILRELANTVKYEDIKKLLDTKELASQLKDRVKEIRPEMNDSWFVRFSSQEDCINAFFWLQNNGKIGGKKVKCRVKSVLQTSSFNPAGGPTSSASHGSFGAQNYNQPPSLDPFRGGFTPPYGPGYGYGNGNFGPMGMPFPAPFYGNPSRGGKGSQQGRRSSRRKSARQQQSPNPRGQNPRMQRQNSQKSRGPKPTHRASEMDGEIYYQDTYVMIDRKSFDQIVKSASNIDQQGPQMPEALKKYEGLCVDAPKKGFELKTLTQGATISPNPPSGRSGPAHGDPLESFSLDSGKKSEDSGKPKKQGGKPKKSKKKKAQQQQQQQAKETANVGASGGDASAGAGDASAGAAKKLGEADGSAKEATEDVHKKSVDVVQGNEEQKVKEEEAVVPSETTAI